MSNTAQEILCHYQALQSELNLPELLDCTLEATPAGSFEMTDEGHNQLWLALEAFRPVEGWLCFQSVVITVKGGHLPQPDQKSGWLLNGELVNEAKESLHIWHEGSAWRATRFTEGAGEEHFLAEDAELLSVESTLDMDHFLHYRVYWCHDESMGFQRHCSRFAGFSSRRRRG